jgi:hypothetical protein
MRCDIPRTKPCPYEAQHWFIPKEEVKRFMKNKGVRHRCTRHQMWPQHYQEISFEESVVAEVMLS